MNKALIEDLSDDLKEITKKILYLKKITRTYGVINIKENQDIEDMKFWINLLNDDKFILKQEIESLTKMIEKDLEYEKQFLSE